MVETFELTSEDRPPVVVCVEDQDGGWTPAPLVSIEAGNLIELDVSELAWLVEDAGPRALEQLRLVLRGESGQGERSDSPPPRPGRTSSPPVS